MADFPTRLRLVMKALSLSRGRLAAELRLDKSVISRWLSGQNAPSGHNLANLTERVAARRPGFTLLDWEADLETLGAKLGVGAAPPSPNAPLDGWLPDDVLREARTMSALRGDAYTGLWRTTRPAISQPGAFTRDVAMIRRAENGFLAFRLGIEDMRYEGWAFLTQTQLFAVGADAGTGMFVFTIFNAVLRHRAEVLDGIALGLQRVGGGSPVATAVLMERVGVLSGDQDVDDAAFEALMLPDPFLSQDEVPAELRARLMPDIGPRALAEGGAAVLMMAFNTSLSRGPLLDGEAG
jgi:transcriptional regulator with XRE-family HTH domain